MVFLRFDCYQKNMVDSIYSYNTLVTNFAQIDQLGTSDMKNFQSSFYLFFW